MKTINAITKLLGISTLALIIFELTMVYAQETWLKVTILTLGLILCLVLYYFIERYEKRLENEISRLKDDLANQIKATEQEEARHKFMKMQYSELEAKYEAIETHNVIKAKNVSGEELQNCDVVTFAEDNDTKEHVNICTQCNSSNVRETTHYVICNDCGKRKKKTNFTNK